eukprot:PhF_6_TR43148/c0_g1_i1/m.66038/K12373/HEXA_B; hexosaminidase
MKSIILCLTLFCIAVQSVQSGMDSRNSMSWWTLKHTDCAHERAILKKVNLTTPEALRAECLKTKHCFGFNTRGELKGRHCWDHVDTHLNTELHVLHSKPRSASQVVPFWPAPQTATQGSGVVTLDSNSFVFLGPQSADLKAAFKRYQLLMFPHTGKAPEGSLTSATVMVKNLNVPLQLYVDESYTLDISPTGISLTANTVYGAYHGMETLSQLVVFNFDTESYQISGTPWMIQDAPRFPHRGLLVDSARHFEPLASLKNVLDSMSYAKLNAMHWHIVDSQSFPFDSPSYPLLGRNGSYSSYERYTTDDVADIVEYARQRGIRVMMEIDNPGHAASWCNGYPEICPSPTCTQPLNPANPKTFDVLGGLLNDFTGGTRGSGLVPENLFHLGGDEVDTSCWSQSPTISAWMKAQNLTTDQTYMYFVQKAQAIAHAQGRDVVGWEEIWNHFGTKLDKSTIIHIWLGGSTNAPAITNAGYRLLWSVDGVWYLDGLSVSWQTMYSAEPCTGVTDQACGTLVLGGEGCMWGETVDTSDILQTIWPRMAAIAERLWSPRGTTDIPSAMTRISGFRCLLNRRGISAAPVQNSVARSAPPGPGGCYSQ